MGLVATYKNSFPIYIKVEYVLALLNISQCVPVLETGAEIVRMADRKNLYSVAWGAVDNPTKKYMDGTGRRSKQNTQI